MLGKVELPEELLLVWLLLLCELVSVKEFLLVCAEEELEFVLDKLDLLDGVAGLLVEETEIELWLLLDVSSTS